MEVCFSVAFIVIVMLYAYKFKYDCSVNKEEKIYKKFLKESLLHKNENSLCHDYAIRMYVENKQIEDWKTTKYKGIKLNTILTAWLTGDVKKVIL